MNVSAWVNIDLAERFLRVVAGFFAIQLFLLLPILPGVFVISIVLCLYLLLTALIAWDPFYALFYKLTELMKISVTRTIPALP